MLRAIPQPSQDFQVPPFLNTSLLGSEVQLQYCVHMCTREIRTSCHNPTRDTFWLHITLSPFQKDLCLNLEKVNVHFSRK